MNILFDAKWFYTGNVSGRAVVINMINRFSLDFRGHTFYLILDKRDKGKDFPFQSSNIKLLYVNKIINNQITNIFLALRLRKLKFDIGVFQYYAPIFSSFKTVVYIHDVIFMSNPEYFTLKERIYFSSMRLFASLSDAIVTVSKTEIKRLRKYNFTPKSRLIDFVYNGVDDVFRSINTLSINEINNIKGKYSLPDKFILYVGRLNERKNLSSLIESMNFISDSKIKLVVIGSYDWKSFDLKYIIGELNLSSRIILLGHVNSNDLPIIYSISTLFCYVSFAEGFGIPILEALKSEIPVVASDLDVFKELFLDVPFYVDPNSPLSIATGINKALLFDNSDRIAQGLKLAESFRWQASANKLVSFLEKVIQN